jgi:catechol 2,3-dioxygenase-like lactoylglutathione lyase family enzyme
MILAFSHPGIVVSDLDKAVAFYRDMFGFRVISDQEGWENSPETDQAIGCPNSASKGAMMAGHNCYLEIFEYSSPAPTARAPGEFLAHEPGIRHIAFYVDDVRKEFERFLGLGGSKLGELVEGVTVVYGRDPFGNIIELCEIPSEEENPTQLPGVNSLGEFKG